MFLNLLRYDFTREIFYINESIVLVYSLLTSSFKNMLTFWLFIYIILYVRHANKILPYFCLVQFQVRLMISTSVALGAASGDSSLA